MERQGKPMYYYSEAFKQKIILEIESGKLTIEQARRIYNIGGNEFLYWWKQYHTKMDKKVWKESSAGKKSEDRNAG